MVIDWIKWAEMNLQEIKLTEVYDELHGGKALSGKTVNPEEMTASRELSGGGGGACPAKMIQVLTGIDLVTKWMDKQVEELKNYPSKKRKIN